MKTTSPFNYLEFVTCFTDNLRKIRPFLEFNEVMYKARGWFASLLLQLSQGTAFLTSRRNQMVDKSGRRSLILFFIGRQRADSFGYPAPDHQNYQAGTSNTDSEPECCFIAFL